LIRSSFDGILAFDRNCRYTVWNAGMQRISGVSESEVTGKRAFEVFPFLKKTGEDKFFSETLKGKVVVARDRPYTIPKTGRHGFFEGYYSPLRDKSGKIVGGIAIVHDITERRYAEEQLMAYQKQLRSLASELSLAEERLRRRMAVGLHDLVGQNIAVSKIKLASLRQTASSAEFDKTLSEIERLLTETLQSTISLTFELSPPVLYELGFKAAMEWLVRQTEARHGVPTEFRDDGRDKPLEMNVSVLLFQAVRELLVNAVKHARAKNLTVLSRKTDNRIRIIVEDDGVGFELSEDNLQNYLTGGFGLFSIRERLNHIGGCLDIQSEPGSGTRVVLEAPLLQKNKKSKGNKK
ncbi:MAG: PAS domain-containing sensor histidine kinase, partial [Planctomycetota bacterium]